MQFGRNDEHQTLAETFGALDDNLDKVLDIHTVQPLMAPLPEREQTILALRFFDNMTQTEIANRIGCSQMHVSRLLAFQHLDDIVCNAAIFYELWRRWPMQGWLVAFEDQGLIAREPRRPYRNPAAGRGR